MQLHWGCVGGVYYQEGIFSGKVLATVNSFKQAHGQFMVIAEHRLQYLQTQSLVTESSPQKPQTFHATCLI